MAFPDWVEKHRKPGVELRYQSGKYYAYRVTSQYDPKLKRSKKITLEYLGAIKKEGLTPPKHKQKPRVGGRLDAGNIVFLDPFVNALQPALAKHFPDDWQTLLAAAALKLCYLEPCSRLELRFETSLAKRRWPKAALDDDAFPKILRRVGFAWDDQRNLFRDLASEEKHMAIDLSHVFSDSENIPWLEYGHNGDDVWRPQLQMLLCWGTTTHRPGFLQLLLGATNSAQTLAHAIKEVPLQEVIAIVDKGFWSPDNVKAFEAETVHYVMALRRDLPIVHLRPHTEYQDHFMYRGHAQWYRQDSWEGRTIYHFLDKRLGDDEESAILRRIDEAKTPEQKDTIRESYRERRHELGTLSLLTDAGLTAAQAYTLYKERREIEYAYDALQNELRGDVTWMRSAESMVGYHFILFLALHLYSQVLDHLKRKKLLSTYSVRDVLTYLSKVDVVEIDGKEHALPVTRQTQHVIDRLEVPITEKLGL
ncbi:MAG: transposase [Thermoplasmatota archaeon]